MIPELIHASLELDRVLLQNIGLGDEWPIQLSFDEDIKVELFKAMNDFGDALKAFKNETENRPQNKIH